MSFSNPTVITVNSVDYDCDRIDNGNYGSHYQFSSPTQRFDLKIKHSPEKPKAGVTMHRHNVDLTWTVFSSDATIPDTVRQAYIVLRNGSRDVDVEVPYLLDALTAFLASSTVAEDLVAWNN